MCKLAALTAACGLVACATAADTIFAAGSLPSCAVEAGSGRTVIAIDTDLHMGSDQSWHCSHSTSGSCACAAHPTHAKGGCKSFDHTNGKTFEVGTGDCTDSGKNCQVPDSDITSSTQSFYTAGSGAFAYKSATYQLTGPCPAQGCFAARGGGNGIGMYGERCDIPNGDGGAALSAACSGKESGTCTWSGGDPAASACYIKVSDDAEFFRLNVDCNGCNMASGCRSWSCNSNSHDGITFYDAAGTQLRKIRGNGSELEGNNGGFTYFDALPAGTSYVYIRGGGISRFHDYSTTNVAFYKCA